MRYETVKEIPTIKIALTGKLRSGKTEVARLLADELDYNYGNVFSFGSSLKYYASKIFEDGGSESEKPRSLYQQFGQLMRRIDEEVWVKHLDKSIRLQLSTLGDSPIVIDDLRQPNEYQWARDNGFIIVRVEAGDEIRRKRAKRAGDRFDEGNLNHETESHSDGFEVDAVLVNDGEHYGELRKKVRGLVEELVEINAEGGR